MTYLLDTSAFLSLMEREDQSIREIVRSVERRLPRSMGVIGELIHGREVDPTNLERRATVEMYQELTEWTSGHPSVFLAARYGEISAVASKEKLKIGQNDRWIIAEAADLGANLITFDQVQAQVARKCIARGRSSFGVRLLGGEG